ncbi:MAG TPA: radical SAM family heme chaperone HemW [Candidatus Dormibacteraeota bacterium]|jgi:oxygen-independent coproporphyrinogen-3 oxidase|nr:radical SAM family heme chaperone HemW [Candidatus Dormibacteraeota bacterium]
MHSGIYISVPFCKSKCTYCNFASGVFSAGQMGRYVERLGEDISWMRTHANDLGAVVPENVDSIYLGGGTPSLLPPDDLKKIFFTLRQEFKVLPKAEVTVECAPGTLTDGIIQALATRGVNRVSLGVQSFVDKEAASVARLHTREKTLSDIERLRKAGISNINVDLIAGLPHQTPESWEYSLDQAIETGVPHVSVYMLEVDEDSRLGRELIAGGTKYHAHFVPDDDMTADFYETARERLNAAGIEQYEISNFAREGFESRHNLKYWTRQPYLGFGVDAHSMLPARNGIGESVRLATTDDYDRFFVASDFKASAVSADQALEESFFLGLRLNRGVDLGCLREEFGDESKKYDEAITELEAQGLLCRSSDNLKLTARGRLLSNDVFQRFIESKLLLDVPDL